MVNDYAEDRIVDNDGEILINKPTYDEVPILIILMRIKSSKNPVMLREVYII